MEILRTIALYIEDKQMPFLIIGGHAMGAHGLSRQTGDLDFVVPRTSKQKWSELMGKLHYRAGQSDDRFARYRPESLGSWPIDLMFVDDPTFQKLWADSIECSFGFAQARVVSARHLATMKIHALKIYQEHRSAKDYGDLLWLLRSQRCGLSEQELKELCQKYASLELFEKLKREGRKL